jgi:hypothetical protein
MSVTEVVGTICALLVTIGLAVGFAANMPDGMRAAPFLVLAAVFALVTPISALQTRYRHSLCARLAVDGLETTGEVIDRWLFGPGNPSFGVLRCSFRTTDGTTHVTDVYELADEIRKYPVGRAVSVRYDPADPRTCAIDCAT